MSTPISKLQPDSVKKRIGEHGEYLKGEFVTKDSDIFENDNFVKYRTSLTIDTSVPAQDDTPLLISHFEKLDAHYSKLQHVMNTGDFTGPWSANWNRELNTLRTSINEELGNNLNDYMGECPQAFFNISV